MALFSISNTRITGVAAAVPKREVSNKFLTGMSAEEIELLIDTTGIEKRRVASDELCASDLCRIAAEKLLEELQWERSEIEALIFVTQTPDYQVPGNSMLLQEQLSLPTTCLALDINQGCAGYVYGLSVLTGLMSASGLKKGLLLVGDTITRLLDKDDKGTVPIFSDAGTATAIEFDADAPNMSFNLQTDGRKHNAIIVEEGGARKPAVKGGSMKMRGHDIFTFGLKEVAPNIAALLQFSGMKTDEIDFFVLHQANKLLNEAIRKKIGVDLDKMPGTLHKFGNTSCATIPLTLVSELKDILKTQQRHLILSGFGVGLSWGSVSLEMKHIVCPELIEIE